MKLSFVKTSPAQNVTVLVTSPVPREKQAKIAAKLLAYDGVGGEQAGFLEAPAAPGADARLQMMGGEFCGNAAMSLGAYLARRDGLADGETARYALEISGADARVPCEIARAGGDYVGRVDMPLPAEFKTVRLPLSWGEAEYPLVALPGISHVIVPAEFGRIDAETLIQSWQRRLNVPAAGILRFDESQSRFEPLVYVAATETRVWERGCGSGTAAIGCYLSVKNGSPIEKTLYQPGGEISVRAETIGNRAKRLTISTRVKIVCEGDAFV